MSGENFDLVRRFYRSWSDGNIDGVLEIADPDIEFDWSESRSPYQGVYRGHEGLARFWREQTEAWEKFNIELVEAIDCGPDCVIAVTGVHGRGRGSGIAIDATGAAGVEAARRRGAQRQAVPEHGGGAPGRRALGSPIGAMIFPPPGGYSL
jgi:ketosteroid isomerase-like protein